MLHKTEKENLQRNKSSHQETYTPASTPLPSSSTFREVVDDRCAALDLFLVPLRKAHSTLGYPLYRITPSATGQGPGLSCYFEDNVLWVSKATGQPFEPVSLEDLSKVAKF